MAQGDTAKRAALGDPSMRGTTGTLSGTVSSAGGRPIEGVDVVVRGTALRARTGRDGRFSLRDVGEGDHSILVRRIGWRPVEFSVQVEPGTEAFVPVTLQAMVRELGVVTITEETFNELSGLVTDANDQPLEGVEVQVLGTTLALTTRKGGGFLFFDVPPGKYLLRLRRPGYRMKLQGVEMLPRINRNLTVRVAALARGTPAGDSARLGGADAASEAAHADFTARRGMAGSQAVALTGDELAPFGAVPLPTALERKLVAREKELAAARCVLVDGEGAAASGTDPARAGRAALQAIVASSVELVELYPAGSEKSMTACKRFAPESRECSCAAARPAAFVVVWLRH